MRGNRFSSLPTAEYCGQSARINVGAGRAAVQSSCYHAMCAGDESEVERLLPLLTDEEASELATWHRPTLPDLGPVKRHSVELKLALDEWGAATSHGNPDALAEGTADIAVLYEPSLAFIGDLKRSHFTSSHDSLQLHGYALAWAAETDATHYQTGIWSLTEGGWRLGQPIEVGSDTYKRMRDRVLAAAGNTDDEYRMGAHCNECYSRFRCPAWGLAPEQAPSALAQYVQGGLTAERAVKLLELVSRAEDMAQTAKDHLKAFVAQNGPIVWGDKQWGPVEVKGRASFDAKRLEKEMPDVAQRYMRLGKGGKQYRWTKAR